MRISAVVLGVIVAVLAVTPTDAARNRGLGRRTATTANPRSEDEKAIRQVVDAFVSSYNSHDAAAVAKLFTPDGTTAGEEGAVTRGRGDIEKLFANIFKQYPKTQMENSIESIRFVGQAEAVENGTTTTVHDQKTPVEKSRYRVMHVKRDGKWQMASAADLPEDAWTGADELKQLQGLIGDWIDESPEALVLTSYNWTDNHRFILGKFTVQLGGKPAMTGTHRIGWDPLKKTIRSWVFDTEGGFSEGTWIHDGDK